MKLRLRLLLGGAAMTTWACGAPSAGQPAVTSPAASRLAAAAEDELLLRWIEPLDAHALTPRDRATQELALSRALWTELVARQGGEYAYLRSFRLGSDDVQNTVLEVRGGLVVQRACDRWGPTGRGQRSLESGASLGSEPNCHPAETVEHLYARCAALLERAPGDVLLELHQNGILAACALPTASCSPSSVDCITLRWAWEPRHERPCLGGQGVRRHGSSYPVVCNECTCLNGRESCTDGGQDRCR